VIVIVGRRQHTVPNSGTDDAESHTAAGIRPLVIGRVIAVFMRAVLTLAVSMSSIMFRGRVRARKNALAVVGNGVGSPEQWPDDCQNPSNAQKGGLAHGQLNSKIGMLAVPSRRLQMET
jgi:hypothetical protein